MPRLSNKNVKAIRHNISKPSKIKYHGHHNIKSSTHKCQLEMKALLNFIMIKETTRASMKLTKTINEKKTPNKVPFSRCKTKSSIQKSYPAVSIWR